MSDFLETIVEHKRSFIKKKENYYSTLKKNVSGDKLNRYGLFKDAISRPGKINLIAEIKKASPSRGLIRKQFNPVSLAKVYFDQGAAAISVLTEEEYFLGKPPYVSQVSENFSIPVLTKDFILDEGQIYETFTYGSSAVLLIVAILSDQELKHLLEVASKLDIDCLVEVHNEEEVGRALKAGAEIIGINNRDLHTFNVDLEVSKKLIPQIPGEKIVVSESGIKTHEEILMLKSAGANAVLIGETFLKEQDVAAKVKELMREEV